LFLAARTAAAREGFPFEVTDSQRIIGTMLAKQLAIDENRGRRIFWLRLTSFGFDFDADFDFDLRCYREDIIRINT